MARKQRPVPEGSRPPDFEGRLYKLTGGTYGDIRLWWTVKPWKPQDPYLSGVFRVQEYEVRMILYPKTGFTEVPQKALDACREAAEELLKRRGQAAGLPPVTEDDHELD